MADGRTKISSEWKNKQVSKNMAFKLIGSLGSVVEPSVINIRCSGTVWPGGVVNLSRTAGEGVSQASGTSTSTMVFGVSLDYAEGASDREIRVIPITPSQLWAADCYDTATTAMIGLKHLLRTTGTDALGRYVQNTSSDAASCAGVFRCVAIDTTTGSGKLIGYFRGGPAYDHPNYTQEDT